MESTSPLTIYLHIPYCRQACHYCNFHFSVNLKNHEGLIQAMLMELALYKDSLGLKTISSIYFGGGTPSMLGPNPIHRLLNRIFQDFSVDTHAEITLEANPDDLVHFPPKVWKALGINRFSIGVQSFHNPFLVQLNRSHNAEQANFAIESAFSAGFKSLSIDLMFGLPGQTMDLWQKDLYLASHLPIGHLSIYGLTVEPKTKLEQMLRRGMVSMPDEDLAAEAFLQSHSFLHNMGWRHYEISNYALAGHESRHNQHYWTGADYLGIGPSAHSLLNGKRFWNPASNGKYAQIVKNGILPREEEQLDNKALWNEMLMTNLRQAKGLSQADFLSKFSPLEWMNLQTRLQSFPSNWFLSFNPIQCSPKGWLMLDFLLTDLFRI